MAVSKKVYHTFHFPAIVCDLSIGFNYYLFFIFIKNIYK